MAVGSWQLCVWHVLPKHMNTACVINGPAADSHVTATGCRWSSCRGWN